MAAGWQVPDPEPGPAPGLAFAGYGERLVAYIVDAIIVGVVIAVVTLVGGLAVAGGAATGSVGAAVGGGFILVIAILVVSLGYFPFFWARGGSRADIPGQMFSLCSLKRSGRSPTARPHLRRPGSPPAVRLLGIGLHPVPRLHLDLRRQAQARLARPHRRHGRRPASLRAAAPDPQALNPPGRVTSALSCSGRRTGPRSSCPVRAHRLRSRALSRTPKP